MPPHLQSLSICFSLSSDSMSAGMTDKYHHLCETTLVPVACTHVCKHSPCLEDALSVFKGHCVSRCNDSDLQRCDSCVSTTDKTNTGNAVQTAVLLQSHYKAVLKVRKHNYASF